MKHATWLLASLIVIVVGVCIVWTVARGFPGPALPPWFAYVTAVYGAVTAIVGLISAVAAIMWEYD